MRIVREQCLAGFASLRPNDPRVAPVKLCEARKQRIAVQRGKEPAIDGNVRNCSGGLLLRLRAIALALRRPPAVREARARQREARREDRRYSRRGRFFNAAAKLVDLLRRYVVEHFAVENVTSKCFGKAV